MWARQLSPLVRPRLVHERRGGRRILVGSPPGSVVRTAGQAVGVIVFLAFTLLTLSSCSTDRGDRQKRIEPVYDRQTGKLQLLKFDSKGSGKIDTWSYMDGPRVVRIEIDTDGDGQIDRWEYYGAAQRLEKVGFSRAHDGKEDAWSYLASDGSISRTEYSTRRNGKITRIE